jgi:hypothetical protein
VYGGERGVGAKVDRPEAQADENEEGDDEDDDAEPVSDVCQLDLQLHYWVILPMEGETKTPLPARTGPTITAMPDGRGLVFGEPARWLGILKLNPLIRRMRPMMWLCLGPQGSHTCDCFLRLSAERRSPTTCRRPGLGGQVSQRRFHSRPALLQVVWTERHH